MRIKHKQVDKYLHKKFGRLYVSELVEGTDRMWAKCVCDCGTTKIIKKLGDLANGKTASCGCYRKEANTARLTTHGSPRLYRIYAGIKSRCYNPKDTGFKYYGAKGVIMCDSWLDNYEAFAEWSKANGYTEDKQIDKDILDRSALLYSPDTCLWVTLKENMSERNSRVAREKQQ